MPLKKYIGRGLGAKSNPINLELLFPQWNNCARRTGGLPCPAWDTAWRWESARSCNSALEESGIMWAARSCQRVSGALRVSLETQVGEPPVLDLISLSPAKTETMQYSKQSFQMTRKPLRWRKKACLSQKSVSVPPLFGSTWTGSSKISAVDFAPDDI